MMKTSAAMSITANEMKADMIRIRNANGEYISVPATAEGTWITDNGTEMYVDCNYKTIGRGVQVKYNNHRYFVRNVSYNKATGEVSGYVSGQFITLNYTETECQNGYTGEIVGARPHLGDTRKHLVEKYVTLYGEIGDEVKAKEIAEGKTPANIVQEPMVDKEFMKRLKGAGFEVSYGYVNIRTNTGILISNVKIKGLTQVQAITAIAKEIAEQQETVTRSSNSKVDLFFANYSA